MNIGRRPYASAVRTAQAAQTRASVADAAAELFVTGGYRNTTISQVARRAGVSAQTVYNTFGTKADLLKAAYDVALAGDEAPIPLAKRPEVQALYAETDPVAFLGAYAALGRRLLDRMGPLALQVAAGAAAGDPELVALRAKTDEERLGGTGMVARRLDELDALAPNLSWEDARDRIWTLNSVEVWHLLTGSRGWSGDRYERWVGEAMSASTLAIPTPGRR